MPLPALLRASYALCNRLGRPLAVGVVILGMLSVAFQAVAWAQAGVVLAGQLEQVVGEERYIEIQKLMEGDTTVNVEQLGTTLSAELDAKLKTMTESEKTAYLESVAWNLFTSAGPGLWMSVVALVILFVLSRAYLLTIAALCPATFGNALRATARRLPGLIGVWILTGLAACVWLPLMILGLGFIQREVLMFTFPALVFPLALVPRFAYAPVLFLRHGGSMLASLHRSYSHTRGKWWTSLSALVGLSVSIWIVMTVLQTFLQMLVTSVIPYSFMGILLYLLVPFLTLAAAAFRACGIVTISDGITAQA